MKKILVALLCLQHIFLYGQGVNLEWAGAYRGVEVIQSNAVAVDNNENVFTTGTFKSTVDFDQGPGVYNMTSIGDQDIFIIKHDADGNFIWAKTFGGIEKVLNWLSENKCTKANHLVAIGGGIPARRSGMIARHGRPRG